MCDLYLSFLYEILNVLLIINLTKLFSETLVITQIFSFFEQIHCSSVIEIRMIPTIYSCILNCTLHVHVYIGLVGWSTKTICPASDNWYM